MTTQQKLKAATLRSLLAADGIPMPTDALLESARQQVHPRPTLAEAELALKQLEANRLISGSDDEISGVSWTLTVAGKHAAQQLP